MNGHTPRGWYDRRPYELTLPTLDCLLGDILKCREPKLIKGGILECLPRPKRRFEINNPT